MGADGGRRGRRRRWLLAVGLALVCALAAPVAAHAEEFIVDSTGDAPDAALSSGGCATAGGKCTLRAAIEEANALEERDEIDFDETVFDGQVSGTIVLTGPLPALTERVRVHGECETGAGVLGPCVGVDAAGAATALTIAAEEVEVEGLAVTNADVGVLVETAPFFRVRGSWFGVALDGTAAADGIGVEVGPGSSQGRVGGEGPEASNLIANSTGVGVRLYGASRVRVLGNRFGVAPNGTTAAPNSVDLEVASIGPPAAEPVTAEGNVIGVRVGAPKDATPACDGGCNLFAGSGVGIDLSGAGAEEAPPVATTVLGNQIGFDASGAPLPADEGVVVGSAPATVIGGPRLGDANRILASDGIAAGPAAPDLIVRGNSVGFDASGGQPLAPAGEGIDVDSTGLESPAVEATISGNRVFAEGGPGIAQEGFGATIAGNAVVGGEPGILAAGSDEEHGNLIEGNLVEGAGTQGVLLASDFNEVLGNEVLGSAGAGIAVHGALPFGNTANRIGGESAASENVVSLSGGAGIEIVDVVFTENEVARNRGFGNLGSFIDLRAAGAEPKGPNEGIAPPVIATATQGGASGAGAKPGARVRVFRKQGTSPGEVESFLGATTADAEGNWQLTYSGAVPGGTVVAATQTNEAGGTSELATATTAGAGGGGGQGPPAQIDSVAPRTRLLRGPARKSTRLGATFRFTADESGVTFQCRLDHGRFHSCRSPFSVRGLKPGRHVFQVRAIDQAGNVDPTPARFVFTVLAGRR